MPQDPFIFRGIQSYIQGQGTAEKIGAYVSALGAGDRACIVADQAILPLLGAVRKSMEDAGLDFRVLEFDGDLRRKSVEDLAARIRTECAPAVVLGVGGGKTIDAAKIIANRLGARCAILATSSSTDAAPSHAAVLVDQRHQISAEALSRNPDLVVVDSRIIASAPVRLFAAGIGDAISKKYEMSTALRQGELNAFGGRPVFFLQKMAAALHDTLLESGPEACRSVRSGAVNDAVERVITACVLLSCLIWENGGLAGAHSIANVLFNAGHGVKNLHGELVAFSLLVLLVLEDRSPDLKVLESFYGQIGLPRTISSLGIPFDNRESITAICDAVHERYQKHSLPYSSRQIYQAIEQLQGEGS
ncbi:MAG TPA: iron-containing alcohol dehydrogenase [Spirochaetia bacterium]|nr:iron-containing alcohol dehydrogenase [Spirochaetia bacterium]